MILASLFFILFTHTFCFAVTPQIDPDLVPALGLYNNGQLLEAYEALNELDESHTGSKEYLLLKAMAKWKMMWLSSYNSEDRREVVTLLDGVDAMCIPTLKEDVSARFYHAAAIGIRAQVAATEGDWWKTAKLGKTMKNYALEIVEADPEFYPAEYLLGSYNYFADALPSYLKFLRVLVFLPGGDRKEGLKQLVRAYEKGGITEGEAATTLAIIYTYYEREFGEGTKMCEKVLSKFPESYDVGLYKGINLYYSKQYDDSIEWLEELRSRILSYSSRHEAAGAVIPLYLPMEREIRYWIARAKIQQGEWVEAEKMLLALADPPVHKPYWLMRGVYLSLAQIDYHFGRASNAETKIDKVMKWEDVKEAHDKAKELRKRKGKIETFEIDFL